MRQTMGRSLGFGVLVAAFLGGMVGQWLLAPAVSVAVPRRMIQADRIWIMPEDGKQRMQIATYTSGGEKGLPLIGLWDNHERLRLLFRLAGQNESPVLIFKDTRGQDRMVMGLSLGGTTEEPFIATFDAQGKKNLLTGSY